MILWWDGCRISFSNSNFSPLFCVYSFSFFVLLLFSKYDACWIFWNWSGVLDKWQVMAITGYRFRDWISCWNGVGKENKTIHFSWPSARRDPPRVHPRDRDINELKVTYFRRVFRDTLDAFQIRNFVSFKYTIALSIYLIFKKEIIDQSRAFCTD